MIPELRPPKRALTATPTRKSTSELRVAKLVVTACPPQQIATGIKNSHVILFIAVRKTGNFLILGPD